MHGRIERFVEPALLLLLRERPRHGYELAHELASLLGEDASLDFGNLYRVLRGLESESVVTSAWRPQATGPPRRTYELTRTGRALLAQWADALARTQLGIAAFLRRYERTNAAGLDRRPHTPPSAKGAGHG